VVGKIASFSQKSASGVIDTEGGDCVDFDVSAVLAYDVSGLAAGQEVNFDLASSRPHNAINVSILTSRAIHYTQERRREMSSLRYMGFDQLGNTRAYRFERMSPGEAKETFTVVIDMGLFKRHQIVIQEGPVLCLQWLSAELEAATPKLERLSPWSITDQNMLAYVASKPAPGTKSARRGARREFPLPFTSSITSPIAADKR
jgi:cold shock CspA family protein